MIEELVRPEVAARDVFGDVAAHRLFAAERALVEGAVEERVREFTTVRWAAAQCLRRLRRPQAPLLPGPFGAPRWPDGLVGSLTHCRGYRAAVVAPASAASGLGVDAEPHAALSPGVLRRTASAGELRHLAELRAAHPAVHWDRLLFCAKEAFYKVWSPAVGGPLGFGDAEVAFGAGPVDGRGGRFVVRLTGAARGRSEKHAGFPALRGRWVARRGILVAAIAAAADELPDGGSPRARGR
ncbi:4'-phosphopantetheinyl transferase superfamily protein [Streptomyces sp. GD-15H]|uniref:4'-phosphopantetheinyl transferase family protein n=1 Tax=Streptomyces sp. GD-15H TaxID=3129112 RepID=UPI003248E359